MSIPNIITLGRILLVPVIVWAIASSQMEIAFAIFIIAGVTMNVQMELRSIAAILGMVASTQNLAFVSRLGVPSRDADVATSGGELHGRVIADLG